MRLQLVIDNGVPQFACDSCYNCKSQYGQSLCKVKNRGCCWYFPKLNLVDIHKMVKSEEGLKILEYVKELKDVKVYNYYIHAKGFFDEEGYNDYIVSEEGYLDEIKDKSIYFRACPFVEAGKGCTIHPSYRSYVCNFYLCDEVVSKFKNDRTFNKYIKERDSYIKWYEYENTSLELLLKEKGYNLIESFNETIELLKSVPLDEYETIKMEEIIIED